MSVLSDFKMKVDVKSSGDGFLELCDERLKGLMRSEPIADVYHVEQTPFARGKFASVRKIRHLASGVEYAAKFIRKRRRAQDTSREIRHEVAVLALCAGSPRLVRLVEVFDARQEVALVLELAAGGELQRVLDDEERLPEMNARLAMRQILEGLRHLHSRNVAHLDLKPQNLLLTEDFPNGEVKLCDFGISRLIEPGVEVREILGTPDYVAPEVLSYEPISLATDIWSVGVLAYVLLSGYSPFAGANKQETFLNISQCALNFPPELFTEVSNLAFDFIRAALVVDPKCRLTVEQCMEHPWLSDDAQLIISPSLESILSQSSENMNGQLCVIIPENCHSNKSEDECEEVDRIAPVIVPLKHPHQRETAPPFPDAPSTPKVSRKSHPDSPTSVLNLCKKFQQDPPKFCSDKLINSAARDKCETNGVYTNGKIVNVLEVCKTYDSLPAAINGKSHTKENNPLTSQNGKSSTCKTCINYKSDIRKVSTDPSYGDCTQCEVPCCNLLSTHTHKHTPASISHVERAILC